MNITQNNSNGSTTLQKGDVAPLFSAKSQYDELVHLAEFRAKQKVVLFFYPKDNTPTCTIEACNLRDHIGSLQSYNAVVIGISPDHEKTHAKFAEKYQLPYLLLADSNAEIAQLYGVWRYKKFMGREYIGLHRTTFIIDEQGIVQEIIEKVKSKAHHEQVIAALLAMG